MYKQSLLLANTTARRNVASTHPQILIIQMELTVTLHLSLIDFNYNATTYLFKVLQLQDYKIKI